MSKLSEEEIIKILEPMTRDIDCLCDCPFKDNENKNCITDNCKERAIQGLLDLYKQEKDRCIELATTIDALKTDYEEEKEKNKELEQDNCKLREMKNKLSIATAIALDGRKISVSKKTLNELNDMFQIEAEYRPFYDDYLFYAR